MNESLRSVVKERVIGLLKKPQVDQRRKIPKNTAFLAKWGFNGVMFLLDAISAITVALLTRAAFGVLTFVAGVFALFLWEKLFENPHANMRQKWIAVGGGVLAIGSTLFIGLVSGIAWLMDVGESSSDAMIWIEGGMIVSLIIGGFVHGSLWAVYYFTDPTHVAEMKRLVNLAWREQQKQGLADAKEDLAEVLEMDKQLGEYDKKGQLDLLSLSYENLRDEKLVQPVVNIDPEASWVVPPPLSRMDNGEL